ncbi:glutaminase A [Lysinibacter sp. HNR]|uniref:glutaminase A n=1 Tax=Lysinibacter sp. HNR TaxID=3031408 RepID=UPI00243589E0|nr:glutaminase A [Lysinibacter sp. HNR]WGD36511.1 glutaminase A [Lysinibacter sp. HNR]
MSKRKTRSHTQGTGFLIHHGTKPEPNPLVSTGFLPPPETVSQIITEAYSTFLHVQDGRVANYIPSLASTSPHLFGISLADMNGNLYSVGDSTHSFSMQSVSKPFVFALILEIIGAHEAQEKIGVNNTGLPFNSVLALEMQEGRTSNPMVNAGAIATTSLAPGDTAEERWRFIHDGLNHFAGRELTLDHDAYHSESATNQRNRGIAQLLEGYGKIYSNPEEATDNYTKQCSLRVTTEDLAVMGATLADGGLNPLTKQQVVSPETCKRVLAVLASSGLYERSGEWLYNIGLPAKSGVSGGLVTISPGKGGVASFSPPLDSAGSSVRGTLSASFLSERLGLNLFASKPIQ